MFERIDIRAGTHHKSSGMYIGEKDNLKCKECKNILITQYPKIETQYQDIIGVYVRNSYGHKKGDPKFKTKYREWYSPFNTILDAWFAVMDYPTVSVGLTKNVKQVFVVDVDEYVDNIEEIKKKYAREFEILQPTYILRNRESGHYQFGFVLKTGILTYDDRYQNKRKYNEYVKKFADLFRADHAYTGPACKNPYYKGFDSEINERAVYENSRELLFKLKEVVMVVNSTTSRANTHNITQLSKEQSLSKEKANDTSSCSYNNVVVSCCPLIYTNTNLRSEGAEVGTSIHTEEAQDKQKSLRCEGLSSCMNHYQTYTKYFRNAVFAYFREFKQRLTDQTIVKKLQSDVIEQMTAEGWIFNNMRDTERQTKSILKWCNTVAFKADNDVTSEATKTRYGENTRRKSLESRRRKKFEKIAKFRAWMSQHANEVDFESKGTPEKGKISKRKAAELIGISYDEFRNYYKMVLRGEISYEIDDECNGYFDEVTGVDGRPVLRTLSKGAVGNIRFEISNVLHTQRDAETTRMLDAFELPVYCTA